MALNHVTDIHNGGAFTKEAFLGGIDFKEELRKVDIDTTPGYDTYTALTGDNTLAHPKILKQRQKDFINGVTSDLEKWVVTNAGPVTQLLDDQTALSLGGSYLPTNVTGNAEYNATIQKTKPSKLKLERIEADPDGFFNDTIAPLNATLRDYLLIADNKEAYIAIDKQEATKNIFTSVEAHGAKDFLKQTISGLYTHREEFENAYKQLIKETEDAVKSAEIAKSGSPLTPQEYAAVKTPYVARMKALGETYKDIQMYEPLMNEFITENGHGYQAIKNPQPAPTN